MAPGAAHKPTDATTTNTKPPKKPTTGSKIAGFWRKDKHKDNSKAAVSQQVAEAAALIRSGTYEKLDEPSTPGDDVSRSTAAQIVEEARRAKEKRAAKVKLWRRTYTKGSDHEQDDDASSSSVSGSQNDVTNSASSQQELSAASSVELTTEAPATVKKNRLRRSGLFRRSKPADEAKKEKPEAKKEKPEVKKEKPQVKKEKPESTKKRFTLWRRDSKDQSAVVDEAAALAIGPLDAAQSDQDSRVDTTPTQVVQPFNYVPAQAMPDEVDEMALDDAGNDDAAPRPTKTEMLMARRRRVPGSTDETEDARKTSFLVTTV